MKGLIARARSFWRAVRSPEQLAAEMDEEMRFHMAMEAERLVREARLHPDEARRQAAIAFGGMDKRKEEGRDARGLSRVTGLSLDLKLACRMLVKSPGITVVGILGLAVGVGLAVGFFVAFAALLYPELPLDEGDRIIAIENHNVETGGEPRQTLYDLLYWREELRSIEQISAFAMSTAELGTADGPAGPVRTAQMTASGFQATRVPPLLGRYLVEADERPGASRVTVIGHDLWRERFAGDPGVLGQTVLIGDAAHQVVGVMPPGFEFPMTQEIWTPLTVDQSRSVPGEGPVLIVFGRLAPGATWEQAQAELDVLGRRAATNHPESHAQLRPEVRRYTHVVDGSALGRRVRFVHDAAQQLAADEAEFGPWFEIVGVVEDMRSSAVDPESLTPELYYPVLPGQLHYAEMLVHVRRGDTNAFAPRLRSIAAELDPDLRVASVANLATRENLPLFAAAGTALLLMLATVFLLSAAGMHALMSLTVTRQRKEIGIRTALGAGRGRLLTNIFSRAAWQLGLGGCLGAIVGARLLVDPSSESGRTTLILAGVMAMMVVVGLGAAAGPARRGLAIQPMDALRDE